MKKIIYISALLGAVGLFCLYSYGRSLWFPLFVKLTGGQSEAEAVSRIQEKGRFDFNPKEWAHLIVLGLKQERVLEVWGEHIEGDTRKIADFPFAGFSGTLGPKLKEGDGQIPEGLYKIEYLNPNSSFHLSVKIDYPNLFDRKKGKEDGRENLGFDIFIHGKSATVGCIPLGDENIEKLFYMISLLGKQNVDVILAPYDMRSKKIELDIPEIEWESELYTNLSKAIEEKLPTKSR